MEMVFKMPAKIEVFMSEIQAIGGPEGLSCYGSQEENLEEAVRAITLYLIHNVWGNTWEWDYAAYMVLRAIFVSQDNGAFKQLEQKMNECSGKLFYNVWDRGQVLHYFELVAEEKPMVHAASIKSGLVACLKGLLSEVELACSGMINNQRRLNIISVELKTVGLILSRTHLSPALSAKGKDLEESVDYFPRLGWQVGLNFRTEIHHLIDLLEKS